MRSKDDTIPETPDPDSTKNPKTPSSSIFDHLVRLTVHVATVGFMQGVGSDITVRAFEKEYHLHRLILVQSKFFENMLQGPWQEQRTSFVPMQFDDLNISQEGFEIAIGRLYGIWVVEDEPSTSPHVHNNGNNPADISQFPIGEGDSIPSIRLTRNNVLSVLATAAYLGIDSLCELCTRYVIRSLSADYVVDFVNFSHSNCYYPWSTQIADACHAYLCRNGFEDSRMECLQVFETLPVDWLLKVVGSDAFWVPSEWERYKFCRRVVSQRRRIRQSHTQKDSQSLQTQDHFVDDVQQPITTGSVPPSFSTLPYDSEQKDGHTSSSDSGYQPGRSRTASSVYSFSTSSSEEAIYNKLFTTSIVYLHMTFEQLQLVLNDSDPLTGYRFTHSGIVHEALWQQVEFRTLIEGASTSESILSTVVSQSNSVPDYPGTKQRMIRVYDEVPEQDTMHEGDLFNPRFVAHNLTPCSGLQSPALVSIAPENKSLKVRLASAQKDHSNLDYDGHVKQCSKFAPYRFSVKFKDMRPLQENIRVSSEVFFYAGSFWNVYVQKVAGNKLSSQLGVYLHRHSVPAVSVSNARLSGQHASSESGSYGHQRGTQVGQESHQETQRLDSQYSNSESLLNYTQTQHGIGQSTLPSDRPQRRPSKTQSSFKRKHDHGQRNSQGRADSDFDSYPNLQSLDNMAPTTIEQSFSCFMDTREKTKTWFKIFAVSVGPDHLIQQFQSSPDDFTLMQSWGWQSECLCSSMFMPDSNDPRNELEEKFQTACMGLVNRKDRIDLPEEKGKQNAEYFLPHDSSSPAPSSREQHYQNQTNADCSDDTGCSCEATLEHGGAHHHHPYMSQTLKFSIVMGHV
ncbi:hypothetical protein BGZ83_007229 [Gryganskiella cystojenkinii]|nr:hypothetical protein BGZ83_007229 [Gryganskiella cystojenkinii]